MGMGIIPIKCKGAININPLELVEFQGELKSLSQQNYERLKRQILKQGFSFPQSVWKDPSDGLYKLIDGHQRYRVIKKMIEEGYSCETIPCSLVEAKDKKEAKRKLLSAAATYGTLESQGLYEFMTEAEIELDELVSDFNFPEIDFPAFGKEFFEDSGITGTVGGEDDVPSTLPEPKVKLGEVYILGEHRLLCGDSTDATMVSTLVGQERMDLLLTDPPYGVSYMEKNAAVNGGIVKNNVGKQITNDTGSVEDMGRLWGHMFSHADHFTDEASYYVFSPQGGELMMMMMQAIHQSKWQLKHSLIWQKQNFVFGRCDYHYQHESVLYGWKKKGTHNWYADRSQSSLLKFDKPHRSDLHPTTKPIDILEYLIGNSTKSENRVLDLFGGSGSTLIACEKTNRKCFMMEIDPHYCQVILDRWEKFSGKKAFRESDQKPWSEIRESS